MSLSPTLQARLDEIHPAYTAIQAMRRRWLDLQSLEQARADYDRLVAAETQERDRLQELLSRLESEQRRKDPLVSTANLPPVLDQVPVLGNWGTGKQPPLLGGTPKAVKLSYRREETTAAGRRLKKLVNRWAYTWRLDAQVVGQINRIVDDADRPLGEALALLDWSVYEALAGSPEGEAVHLNRLAEWEKALQEYQVQLVGEIDTREIRFRDYLGIWEQWQRRDQPGGQAAWETFIAETRQALKERIVQIEQQIARFQKTAERGGP